MQFRARPLVLTAVVVSSVIAGIGVSLAVRGGDSGFASSPAATVPASGSQGASLDSRITEVQPPRVPLDLDPIEYDLAALELESGSEALGVPWLGSKESVDPTPYLLNDEQRRLFDLLVGCFPPRSSNPAVDDLFAAKTACFDPTAIHEAATVADPTDLFDAMHAMNLARPDVFTACHNGSHKIGLLVLNRVIAEHGFDEAILHQLISAGRSTCMGGLVHGLLDAVGLVAENVESYASVVSACERAVPSASGQCGDAVGHSVWDAFENIEQGAAACAYFTNGTLRDDCSEGLLMRMYQRLSRDSDWYDGTVGPDGYQRWIDETLAWCSKWPSTPFAAAAGVDPREGCWRGVIYPLAQPVFHQLRLANGEYPPAKAVMLTMLQQTVDACMSFPDNGPTLCLDRLGTYVGHMVMFDRNEVGEVCDLWPIRRDECVDAALQRIDSAEEGR